MEEISSKTVTIEASAGDVSATLADLESFPNWSTTIKQVEVHERDGSGRPTSATVKIEAGVLKDRAKLNYDYSAFPNSISFTLEEADLMTEMTGSYSIKDDGDNCEVTYSLNVQVSMPVPDMMRRKAEMATIEAALSQLKKKLDG
ncbi:MAG: polyketide cyclase / dehydrase and lipid transport [Actinobacteria bacterium]|nr:polyketide cyclase / dehydrase and lipid transport [Actinomycetota bacterium]